MSFVFRGSHEIWYIIAPPKEWLVSAVMSMYTGAKTVIRTVYGNSKGFEVKVGKPYAPRFRFKPVVIRDCHGGHI